MKKKFLVVLLAILFVLTLGACQTTALTTKTSRTKKAMENPLVAGDAVDLEICHAWGASKEACQDQIIEDFCDMMYEEYGVTVTIKSTSYSDYGSLKETLDQRIKASYLPNIVHGYPDHFAEYLKSNVLLCLDDYINDQNFGIDLDEFIPGFLAENNQFDGVYYSLPYAKSTEVMVYNKTAIESATLNGEAIEIPYDSALTWNELINIWKNAVNEDGETFAEQGYLYLAAYDSSDNLFINFSRQLNCPYTRAISNEQGELLVDNADTKKMLTYVATLIKSKYLALPLNFDDNASYASSYFQEQNMLFTIGSTAGITYNLPDDNSFEVGVALVPQFEKDMNGNDATKSVVQQGPDICIFDTGNEKENFVSWLFLKYTTVGETWDQTTKQFIEGDSVNAQLAINTSYFPVTTKAINSDNYQEHLNIAKKYYNGEQIDEVEAESLIFSQVAYVSLTFQSDYFQYDPSFCSSTYLLGSSTIRTQAGSAIETIASQIKSNAAAISVDIDQVIDDMVKTCKLQK